MDCRQVRIALENQASPLEEGDAAVRAGFIDELITTAVRRGERSHHQRLAMAAAVATIAIAAGLLFNATNATFEVRSPKAYEVAVAPHLEKMVDVIVDSVADRDTATLTIELAKNVQLRGFPNERIVSWQTPLREGKNLLRLPVILTNDQDGQFEVGLSYGDTARAITVIVLVDSEATSVRV